MKTGPKPKPIAERFLASIPDQPGEDCWEWQGPTTDHGYGTLCVGSKSDGSRRNVLAHRLSYETFRGTIPAGMGICHACDNMRDASRKGRCRNPFQSEKTHCKYGHEFTAENTRRDELDRRVCKQCQSDRAKRSYYKHHARSLERVRVYRERLRRVK
jgi:hypothetical protein